MFIPEPRIEAAAARLWHRFDLAPGFDVEQLVDDLGLGLVWEEITDDRDGRILGQLVPHKKLVVLNERHLHALEAKEGRLRRFTLGHEIGHWELHAGPAGSQTLPLVDGRTWCRDKSRRPEERQAEMFAAALLMPRDQIRAALPELPWVGWPTVYRLADAFGVNLTPMKIRLDTMGCMHLRDDGVPRSGAAAAGDQEQLF